MAFEMASSNRYSRSAADMGFSLEVKRSSRPRESSKVVRPKLPSPHANQILESQDKQKIENPFGRPYLDLYHESRRSADDALLFHPKSSGNSQKPWIGKKANKDDELIKHMSNLPGYLQRVEKGENFQGKALNFGVLDWERLEKWKYNKKHISSRGDTHASLAGSNSSTVQSKSLAPHKKKFPSHCPHLNSYHKEGFSQDVKQSRGKIIQQDFEIAPKNTLNGLPKPHQTDKSSGRNYSEIKLERGMRKDADQKITLEKETSLSGLRKHGFSHVSKREKRAQSSVATYRVEELQESEYYLGKKHSRGDHKSVVALLPKHSPQKSCSEVVQPSELKAPFHAKPREANWESFPNGFATEVVHSAELYRQIPHSCPLPLGVETNSESGMRPHSLTHTQSMELPNDACRTFMRPNETPAMLSQCKCVDENASSVNPSNANAIDAPKSLDHEATEPATVKGSHSSPNRQFSFSLSKIRKSLSFKERSAAPQFSSTYAESTDRPYDASCTFICPNDSPNTPSSANAIRTSKHLDQETTEPAAVKGSYPPPNRRFNFTPGMMSRSFSSKEGSSVPQLSSTYATVKSGPVRSEVYDSLDNASKSKANHSRTRSSPLRRLLDPLLKTRVTIRHHSSETVQQLTRNLNLTSEVTSSTESVQDKSHEASTVQALVQLTMKNGLPLFKLVVNNNSDILFATKKINSLSKDDTEWIYTFYSVHEIKKKSGSWINHGHKGKGYEYGYNIVGQMKILSSCYPDLMVQSSKDQFTVRESVLYSGNLQQVDEGTQELMPNGELAAIIVKIPIGNSCNDGDRRNKGKESVGKRFLDCLKEDGNSFEKRETENFNSTTVILPGGAHGLPNKGVPSPLIERWKSGGSCDCGGWDVGCKLRILANDDQSCQFPGPSISFSNPDHFELFNQGGAQDSQPIFSLAPFKEGIYSVEFSASISLLQAFSICVEVISSQKSFGFSEVNHLSEAKLFHESAFTGSDRRKTPTNVRGQVPTNYVPAPPPSPVGRV